MYKETNHPHHAHYCRNSSLKRMALEANKHDERNPQDQLLVSIDKYTNKLFYINKKKAPVHLLFLCKSGYLPQIVLT